MKTQISGRLGEDAACKYLKKKRYQILERNYHTRYGEIDIVAKKGDCVAFVEVKTRSATDYGMPSEAVTLSKQQKIIKTAQTYIQEQDLDAVFSVDIIEVLLEKGKVASLNHIENAFTT